MHIVVGKRLVDFKTKDGERIDGLNLYCNYPEDNVEGYAVEKIFLGRNKFGMIFDSLAVGDAITVVYNKHGRVSDVIVSA